MIEMIDNFKQIVSNEIEEIMGKGVDPLISKNKSKGSMKKKQNNFRR